MSEAAKSIHGSYFVETDTHSAVHFQFDTLDEAKAYALHLIGVGACCNAKVLYGPSRTVWTSDGVKLEATDAN